MERLPDTLARTLVPWYEAHARPLPWRQDPSPYRVWVSEIMLQQTRIEAARGYFERFMAALPTVQDLAAADEQTVLKLWEGLGYYSRARNLRRAAIEIVERHGGRLPADEKALRALPGIGDYTAGAVASIAFGLRSPAVDGNVLRICARLTCCPDSIGEKSVKDGPAGAVPGPGQRMRGVHLRADGAGRDGVSARDAGVRRLPIGGGVRRPLDRPGDGLARHAGKSPPARPAPDGVFAGTRRPDCPGQAAGQGAAGRIVGISQRGGDPLGAAGPPPGGGLGL